jgi:hypothetical protein
MRTLLPFSLLLSFLCSTGMAQPAATTHPAALVAYPELPLAREPEEAPQGIRYLATADSLEKLAAQSHPDLAWQERDGAWTFIWIDRDDRGTPRIFTADCAHYLIQSGRTCWAFVDPTIAGPVSPESPVVEFLTVRLCRQRIAVPTELHDANQSLVQLVSTGRDGSEVYKVVYAQQAARGHLRNRRGLVLSIFRRTGSRSLPRATWGMKAA